MCLEKIDPLPSAPPDYNNTVLHRNQSKFIVIVIVSGGLYRYSTADDDGSSLVRQHSGLPDTIVN